MGKVVFEHAINQLDQDISATKLFAIVGADSFFYCISQDDHTPTKRRGITFDTKQLFFERDNAHLDTVLQDDPDLFFDFQATFCAVESPAFTCVPTDRFERRVQKDYLAKVTDLGVEDRVTRQLASHATQVFLFPVPATFRRMLRLYFSSARILHLTACLADYLAAQVPDDERFRMFVIAGPQKLHILVFSGKQFLFANRFAARTAEDVLYFATAVARTLKLETTCAMFFGGMNVSQEIEHVLQNYFPRASPLSTLDARLKTVQIEFQSMLQCAS